MILIETGFKNLFKPIFDPGTTWKTFCHRNHLQPLQWPQTYHNINHMLKNVATFEEAVKIKHYITNECWINTLKLNDGYGNYPRMKKMTRDKVLEFIGKTDE